MNNSAVTGSLLKIRWGRSDNPVAPQRVADMWPTPVQVAGLVGIPRGSLKAAHRVGDQPREEDGRAVAEFGADGLQADRQAVGGGTGGERRGGKVAARGQSRPEQLVFDEPLDSVDLNGALRGGNGALFRRRRRGDRAYHQIPFAEERAPTPAQLKAIRDAAQAVTAISGARRSR